MGKMIRIAFRVDNDIDQNCLDKCPFGKSPRCGSYACQRCKYCIGSGSDYIWNLSEPNKMVTQNYIICKLTLNDDIVKNRIKAKIMRLIHLIKMIKK